MAFKNPIARLSQLVADSITGATIRTAASGQRWELSSNPQNILAAYTGISNELAPGMLQVVQQTQGGVIVGYLKVFGPKLQGNTQQALLALQAVPSGGIVAQQTVATLQADEVALIGTGAGNPSIVLQGITQVKSGGLNIDTTGGVPGINGLTTISQLNFGRVNQNTNSGGNLVFPHGLASKPSAVFWMDDSANHPYRGYYANGASDATNITITMRRTDTDAVSAGGVSVQGAWLALAG